MEPRADECTKVFAVTAMNEPPLLAPLAGTSVRLEPLTVDHESGLALLVSDPTIWTFVSTGGLMRAEQLQTWMANRIAENERGDGATWAIVQTATGKATGCTSLMDIAREHKRAEVGRTWLGKPYQRTGINTEAKRLLLTHCFETLQFNRVQLKTDARNIPSQRAIERIGATREGTLRAHMILPDGFVRNTVMYSITRDEWPRVKAHLQALQTSYKTPPQPTS